VSEYISYKEIFRLLGIDERQPYYNPRRFEIILRHIEKINEIIQDKEKAEADDGVVQTVPGQGPLVDVIGDAIHDPDLARVRLRRHRRRHLLRPLDSQQRGAGRPVHHRGVEQRHRLGRRARAHLHDVQRRVGDRELPGRRLRPAHRHGAG